MIYDENTHKLRRLTPSKEIRQKLLISYSQDWQTNKICELYAETEDLEEEIGCPLDVVFKAVRQGFIYVDLGHGLYEETNIRLDYGDISPDEEGYIGCDFKTKYHYILDYDGCIFVEDYKKTWWLKADRSE